MGGFVRWYMGSDKNGTDSLAKQIVPASHWPEMRILVLVVKKETFSSCINKKGRYDNKEIAEIFIKYKSIG